MEDEQLVILFREVGLMSGHGEVLERTLLE